MKRTAWFAVVSCLFAMWMLVAQQPASTPPPQKKGGKGPPPIQPKEDELRRLKAKVDELDSLLAPLKNSQKKTDLIADVEVYVKAGRFLLEFPETFFVQEGIDQAFTVLDQGIERARQLQQGQAPWVEKKGRKVYGYYSAL